MVVLLGAACASTNLPPIGSTGVSFVPEDDERRLWLATREAEDRIVTAKNEYEESSNMWIRSSTVSLQLRTETRAGNGSGSASARTHD
jgi:hypothetical protein